MFSISRIISSVFGPNAERAANTASSTKTEALGRVADAKAELVSTTSEAVTTINTAKGEVAASIKAEEAATKARKKATDKAVTAAEAAGERRVETIVRTIGRSERMTDREVARLQSLQGADDSSSAGRVKVGNRVADELDSAITDLEADLKA